jgi:hypothetical protein
MAREQSYILLHVSVNPLLGQKNNRQLPKKIILKDKNYKIQGCKNTSSFKYSIKESCRGLDFSRAGEGGGVTLFCCNTVREKVLNECKN